MSEPTIYNITRGFKARVERSPRVLEIAETFGIGLSDRQFWVFHHLDVPITQGDVIYVTGQSGSGKSLLLRELEKQMTEQGLRVVNLDTMILEEKPLVDQLGSSMTEAIELLSRAGINDAYLAIRKPSELSDGQRYRFKMALLMQRPADVWIADEFGAILDRVTARAVAFNAAKLARVKKTTLIVATTHTDMIPELGPDLIVEKRFQNRVELRRG